MAPLLAEFRTQASRGEGRGTARRTLRLSAASPGNAAGVLIHNLSRSGLMIETAADLAVGDAFQVVLPEAGPSTARVVWARDNRFGCEFLKPVSKATVSAALLRSPAGASEATAPLNDVLPEHDRDRPERAPTPFDGPIAAASLIVLLFAAILFVAALLWLPFSAGQ